MRAPRVLPVSDSDVAVVCVLVRNNPGPRLAWSDRDKGLRTAPTFPSDFLDRCFFLFGAAASRPREAPGLLSRENSGVVGLLYRDKRRQGCFVGRQGRVFGPKMINAAVVPVPGSCVFSPDTFTA